MPACKNQEFSEKLIKRLKEIGVEHVCLAPGSRSTPLVLAVAKDTDLEKTVHYDERALGFYALGVSKATEKPVVIITTSGTAVANMLPAVIEAYYTQTPLILLTADRPKELQNTGSNQTIMQEGIFGVYAQVAINLTSPDEIEIESVLEESLEKISKSIFSRKRGPIHINCPFKEPFFQRCLPPQLIKVTGTVPSSLRHPDVLYRHPDESQDLKSIIEISAFAEMTEMEAEMTEKIAFILGRLSKTDATKIYKILKEKNIPVYTDLCSQLRFKSDLNTFDETDTKTIENTDLFIQFGDQLINTTLLKELKSQKKHHLFFSEQDLVYDPEKSVTKTYLMPIEEALGKLMPYLNITTNKSMPIKTKPKKETYVQNITAYLPQNSSLFCGNSSIIRQINKEALRQNQSVTVYANRGASGIDGLLSTALGVFKGEKKTGVIVLGDLSFLHDQGALDLLKTIETPIKIIITNNNGGGIFKTLPIFSEKEVFETYFKTPHHQNFKLNAKRANLNYQTLKSDSKILKQKLKAFLESKESGFMEITIQD